MQVYIVIENGEAYQTGYKTYSDAVAFVKRVHKEDLESLLKQLTDLEDIESVLADVNVAEDPKGLTRLYIEKGITISIRKVSIE